MTRNNKASRYAVLRLEWIRFKTLFDYRLEGNLVPAAAATPAPIAHIEVVAVKKLVVGFLSGAAGPNLVRASGPASAFSSGACLSFI